MLRAAAIRNTRLQGLARRLPDADDDSGSLMFALLLVVLAGALASLMVPVLLISINGTRAEQRRVSALGAASAGIDVVMAQIRAANDGAGNGVLSKLPCGTLSGTVSAGSSATYSVTVKYYTTDPRGQSNPTQILCIANSGARSAPAYGLVSSTGRDTSSSTFTRTVQATYIFQSTNANIAGGLIHVYKTSSSNDLCIDAGSTSPAVGTVVTVKTCVPGSAQQTWAYNSYLNLTLVSSKNSSPPNGLCLDAGTPEASNAVLKLQTCAFPAIAQQQWSLNDSANFAGTSDGASLNSFCFNVQNQNVSGSQIILSTNCNGTYDNIQTFSPEASVGAGAAGTTSGQLVNFSQFGRCLDIPNYDTGAGYMIAWPCKQAPVATNVGWNQRWALPATVGATAKSAPGSISATDTNGNQWCLTSPQSAAAGQYVYIVGCPGVLLTSQKWTVYTNTTAYATSYRIIDSSGDGSGTGTSSTTGLCLQPASQTSANTNDFFSSGNQVMKLVVQVCSGSTLQKWNAPPNILAPLPLKDINEN
jgi:hypothetical protein